MRLIDADAVKELFCSRCSGYGDCANEGFKRFCSAKSAIEISPTIDAVPVVRCKDCLHYRPMVAFDGEGMCDVFDWKSEPMDYCSFAERKGA